MNGDRRLNVSHSTPASDGIGLVIQSNYDVGGVRACTLLRAFTNDVYRLVTDAGPLIAKVYRRAWRLREDARWEAMLQCEVSQRGGPAPAVIPTREGELIAPVPSPEGTRWCLLQEQAAGEKPVKPFTADLYRRFGESAGLLHTTFNQVNVATSRQARSLDTLLIAPLPVIEPLFAVLPPEDWRFVTDLAATVHARLAALAPSLDWGICHGDLSLDNVVQMLSGELMLLDFDLVAPSFRAADFLGVRMSQPDEHWRAFVAGYQSQRTISERDFAAVPWFVPAWTIWSLAHDAFYRVHWHGAWIVGPDQLANRVAMLRSWAEQYC